MRQTPPAPTVRPAALAALALALTFLLPQTAPAGDVGFPEDFALGDREKALGELLPGTEEHYYWHVLHAQNLGRLDEAESLLAAWVKRHGRDRQVVRMEDRQALLRYRSEPRETLEYLRRRLGLELTHQREVVGEAPKLPVELDPGRIAPEALARRALERHPETLGGFEDRALEWALALDLDPARRRDLLSRLGRPDVPGLAEAVVADLRHEGSKGFGSLAIHRQLLLEQLDECSRLEPKLLGNTSFANAYLVKLQPSPDADWRHEPEAREAYLERLWAFVSRLPESFNSLKAHVLYHRLVHDRSRGVWQRERFLEYLSLPRQVSYMREYLERSGTGRFAAKLARDYRSVTLLPPVGSDEELVRSYLMRFFLREDDVAPYDRWLDDRYVRHILAETKILAGQGDLETWSAMLPPERYQALRERVDLDFAHDNREVFAPGDPVELEVWVKGVETLIVKVFELNALNYYRESLREIDTSVDLDGLVPNREETYRYEVPPVRRALRRFELPLEGRGVWVVDFIGGGKASRALVRKGDLRYLARTSVAGQVLTVLDEEGRKVSGASLWLGGKEYEADERGEIVVPFTSEPGRKPVVLADGGFARLETLEHQAESYALEAGIWVAREALVERAEAEVVVRPSLTLNGEPVTVEVLGEEDIEKPRLVVTSTDIEGVETTQEVKGFELSDREASVHTFSVPANLRKLTVTLGAQVECLSRHETVDLEASRTFTLAGIETTEKIEDLFLSHAGGTYAIELLGRTGEARPDRAVQLALKHRDFRDPLEASLKTDAEGEARLGRLEGIEWVRATGPEGTSRTWTLMEDRHSGSGAVHGRAGEAVLVPYMGRAEKPLRSEVSLLEVRGGTFARDRFEAVSMDDGYVRIDDVPPGDYDLLLKGSGRRFRVRICEGERKEGYVVSGYRQLEVREPRPLQIRSAALDGEALVVRLGGASEATRVHVAATRYHPAYRPFEALDAVSPPEPFEILSPALESLYVTGRDIGDEYRYIIERKYAEIHPGNMLRRPTLLLNPWALRSTETGREEAEAGRAFGRAAGQGGAARGRGEPAAQKAAPDAFSDPSSLDFLGEPAAVLLNLEPDSEGAVRVERARLGAHHQVHVLAASPTETVYREVPLDEAPRDFKDLRLSDGLDPESHYAEKKEVSFVGEGEAFSLEDITTSEMQAYDTLSDVYALYLTLSGDPSLAEFGFILRWPELERREKGEKYSEYASHELNFFIHEKDPEFFREVVRPNLHDKLHKTFMDRWLLADALTEYLEPWEFARLNVVERILLARRLEEERAEVARHAESLLEVSPVDPAWVERLFSTALRGRALETADELGVEAARDEARRRLVEAERPPAATAAPLTRTKRAAAARVPEKAKAELVETLELGAAAPAEEEGQAAVGDFKGLSRGFRAGYLARRKEVRQLYQPLGETKEWVESYYWHLPIEEQDGDLIAINEFWRDYAAHDFATPFRSTRFAQASRSFPEMMLALSVLDLPFEAAEHGTEAERARFTLRPGSPLLVVHKEIRPAEPAEGESPILVTQSFYRHGDRYVLVDGERRDKFVEDEFLLHVVYGCQVVVTNPTSSPRKLQVLLQVPRGSVPVKGTLYTRSVSVSLEPYRTWTADDFFYFPEPGTYLHFPVHVAREEALVAFAEPATLRAVEEPSEVDRESWPWVSQHGSGEEVLAYLGEHNLHRTDLGRIAWRMREREFFEKTISLLEDRHAYSPVLWSYGFLHDSPSAVREYLEHREDLVSTWGPVLRSELLEIDPVERRYYQHREYWPLVNARAHKLGKRWTIVNDRFHAQYMEFLRVSSHRRELGDEDLLQATYYMLLQDRVSRALELFARVDREALEERLQYDYCRAYLAMYRGEPGEAREIAREHAEHPVKRWRDLFAEVVSQVDEIEGRGGGVVDEEDRSQRQEELAETEPSFSFELEGGKIALRYRNLESCRVSYYLMDIELLFSRNPFVDEYGSQFAYIRPNRTSEVELDPEGERAEIALPEDLLSQNVLVEVEAAGRKQAEARTSGAMAVDLVEGYAQATVRHAEGGKALPRVYVKVYARLADGTVRFYKDGYTDLRGRFDYGSLSTSDMGQVARFSLLFLSPEHGAVVREADPPAR